MSVPLLPLSTALPPAVGLGAGCPTTGRPGTEAPTSLGLSLGLGTPATERPGTASLTTMEP
ncbi:hypothetical protein GCM10010508_23640 [Streptomyces naganishii JCM 4654]|uniref:Uncharacterized protein n=1 Tax=Streptomyces naganishii JCM 4654 TaxID=1306179 RepID=A0A918Y217_9ACTN|nr:hypothetical protein GCM10010508_23640 [Streptomyces naganishii JCM 4654]